MVSFKGRVALVTGAGGGLGRQHALALAARGANVVVNDLAPRQKPEGDAPTPAQAVAAEIQAGGGSALAWEASVTDAAAVREMVAEAAGRWGSVDILVNNAGFVRDKSFTKMDASDFQSVLDVHLLGAFNCTKAVWDGMKARNYGRIVMTTSSSGLWGNFGQANYSAAKMALVGLMQTLSIEGAKNDIRVNCLAPTAATPMTAGLIPPDILEALRPEAVTPGLLYLAGEDAPTRAILCAGAGTFAFANVTLGTAMHLGFGDDVAEQLAARAGSITGLAGAVVPAAGVLQSQNEIAAWQRSTRKPSAQP